MRQHVTNFSIQSLVLLAVATTTSDALAQADWVKRAIDSQSGKAARQAKGAQKKIFAGRTYAANQLLVSRATIANMDRALGRYRKIEQSGKWQILPAKGRALRLGDEGARVKILHSRLVATGDLAPAASRRNQTRFTKATEEAVKRFQFRNGLTPSGRVNSYTRSALNVTAKTQAGSTHSEPATPSRSS